MTFLECSGLVTLVRKPKKLEQKMITLPKGQLISKCLFGAIVSTKKPTKFFKEFLP
jgi:hypothetical protein